MDLDKLKCLGDEKVMNEYLKEAEEVSFEEGFGEAYDYNVPVSMGIERRRKKRRKNRNSKEYVKRQRRYKSNKEIY